MEARAKRGLFDEQSGVSWIVILVGSKSPRRSGARLFVYIVLEISQDGENFGGVISG
jgi:hypothetical protein